VAKKSTRTGVLLSSTLVLKSLSSWIVTIWLDNVAVLVWRRYADCRTTLDDKWLFCVEINAVDGLHAESSLIGTYRDLHSDCRLICNATLNAIPSKHTHSFNDHFPRKPSQPVSTIIRRLHWSWAGFRHPGNTPKNHWVYMGKTRWKKQQKTCSKLSLISVCHVMFTAYNDQ